MKKTVWYSLALGVGVAGCDYQPGGDWRDKCQINSSYDAYEYSRCIDRVSREAESQAQASAELRAEKASPLSSPASSAVTTDPENASRPGQEELGKGHIRQD